MSSAMLFVFFVLCAMLLSALWAGMAWLLVRVLKLQSPVGRMFVFVAPLLAAFVALLRLMPDAKQEILFVSVAIAASLGARDFLSYRRFRGRIVNSRETFARAEAIARPLSAQLNLDPARVYVSDALVSGPVVLGVFQPTIVFPRAMVSRLRDEELQVLLAHELAHIYRRDFLLKWVLLFVRRLSLWNPVASWPYRWLSKEIEFACDRIACRLTGNPGTLARTLCKIEELHSLAAADEMPTPRAIPRADSALRARIAYLAAPRAYDFDWRNLAKTLAIFSMYWLVCFQPAALIIALVNA
jgi:beta-lactamase regulating signal transducer with metallopeptidase domain